ncbi:hypothetical protein D3C80_1167910 [compost metagenome]
MQTSFHIVKCDLIWRNQARFRAHLDSHIAQGHAAFHAQRADRIAAELDNMARSACATGFTDDRQHDIFGGNARCGMAFDFDFHGLRAALFQGLRRQNMFNFRGTNTKRQRTKRAVRGGMGVAADDSHTRQRDALFWTHYVDDALKRVVQVVQFNAERVAVFDQLLHLDASHFTRRIDIFGLGGNVVIHGREGFAWLANLAVVRPQAVKCLRRGDFVHQMAVNVQQRSFV